jgi:hypothetical protein
MERNSFAFQEDDSVEEISIEPGYESEVGRDKNVAK